MPNDLAELTSLNRDYVNSVQHSDIKRFDEILAQDFYCTNPDAVDFATLFLIPPPALAVGRVGRSEAEDGVGGLSAIELEETPPTRHLVRCAHEVPPSPPLARGEG
jgi:hypothetical protein